MKITKTTVDYEQLASTIKELYKLFFERKRMFPCDFRKVARVLINEKTKSEIDLHSGIRGESIFGFKILIDNNIPDGECEIYINVLDVI